MDDPFAHTAEHEISDESCPKCGHTWGVPGLREYGSWSPFDTDDLICPDCGTNLLEDEE